MKHQFLMPDYFPQFSCKMGACRHACCTGWPISFSLEDYFRLINQECSPELRERLDHGMHMAMNPTPDRYAQILPRWDGDCPMRLDDGRCALHAELGEDALADVCRLYPRGIRREESLEISCANSCEGVLEQLFARTEPIRFIRGEYECILPPLPERTTHFPTMGHGQEIRLLFIGILQDRRYALYRRLMLLESMMERVDGLLNAQDEAGLEAVLRDPGLSAPPELKAEPRHLHEGIVSAREMLALISGRSDSVREYGEEALSYFGTGEEAVARYEEACGRFEKAYPDWQIRFEHMLVNHMFFTCFPFQDRPEHLRSEFNALCCVYTLLRFLSIGHTAQHGTQEAFTDVCAAAFRLIDHSEFDRYAVHLLEKMGQDSPEKMHEFIIL